MGRTEDLSFKLDGLTPPKKLDLELSQAFLSALLEADHSDFRAQGPGHLTGPQLKPRLAPYFLVQVSGLGWLAWAGPLPW